MNTNVKNSWKTVAEEVESHIRELLSRSLSQGEQIPSERELAQKLGVSRSSVHRALDMLTREKKLYRIPGKGTFISDVKNKGGIEGGKIALVLPDEHLVEVGSYMYWFNIRDLFAGIMEEATIYGAETHICVCKANLSQEEGAVWLRNHFYNNNFKGFIFGIVSGYEQLIETAFEENIPVVAWDFQVKPYDTVTIDYKPAMYEAVSFLLRSGRKRIMYLGGRARWDVENKFDSYCRAIKDFGLAVAKELVIDFERYPHFGFSAVSKAIRSGLKFDAIVSTNDITAVDAIYALKENGIRIPEDVAVIGSDDMPGMDRFNPPLATLRVPRVQVGRHLFQVIKNRILEPGTSTVRVVLNAQFILRDSAGYGVSCEDVKNKKSKTPPRLSLRGE